MKNLCIPAWLAQLIYLTFLRLLAIILLPKMTWNALLKVISKLVK